MICIDLLQGCDINARSQGIKTGRICGTCTSLVCRHLGNGWEVHPGETETDDVGRRVNLSEATGLVWQSKGPVTRQMWLSAVSF